MTLDGTEAQTDGCIRTHPLTHGLFCAPHPTHDDQGPVGVVSIVGPYHSGKSFMLNQLVRSLAPYTVAGDPDPG